MALKKQKECRSGATGEYWKISNVHLDSSKMECFWTLSLWKDSSFAENEAPSLMNKVHRSVVSKVQANGDLRKLGYIKFKSLNDPDLSGAEDA